MAGFTSAKGNIVGRMLGKNYSKVDPLASSLEKAESNFLDPQMPAPPQAPGTPVVDQAAVDRMTRDLARRRRGFAANQIAGDVGAGQVRTPVLGGG
jgi:hypothetical protein